MRKQKVWSGRVGAFLCAVAMLAAPGIARAQASGESPPDARALLMRMFQFLAKTDRMSVSVQGAYDAVQTSGLKVEWNVRGMVTIRRPDRMRVESEQSNGARSLTVLDGKEIFTFDEAARVYAAAPQPGGIDETLVYLVRDLGMRIPLAVLFVNRAPAESSRRVKSLEYVEKTGILGTPAHHIVGSTDTVDFQVWIADGDQPVPVHIVLTYKNAPGQPQFRGQLSWNLAADAPDTLFTFTPPTDATRIPFLAALTQVAPGSQRTSGKKGAK